jgi:DNA-binding MarR family transcriptional regulator
VSDEAGGTSGTGGAVDSGGALRTSILFDVFALNESVARLLDAAMRGGPLTPGEYAIYSAIFELEAASPTELAARLGMRLTTFMDQLRLLEGRGHARRVEHPRDRRSYRVVLTNAGLEAHRAANRRFEDAFRAFVAHLPDGQASAKAGLLVVRTAAEAAIASFSEAASPRPKVGRAG